MFVIVARFFVCHNCEMGFNFETNIGANMMNVHDWLIWFTCDGCGTYFQRMLGNTLKICT